MRRYPDRMSEVLRTDLLDHGMNAGKEQKVVELLRAWRRCAVLVGREQWRLLFESGRVNKMHRSRVESKLAQVVGAANRLQMVRYQVVGILDSYLANRQNEFTRVVECSSLPAEAKHQLHFVNRWKAWFGREPLVMKDGSEIPGETRALARRIMRRVLSRHRKPDLSRINMVIDRRAATVREAESAGSFDLWLRLSTMERGRPIEVPLRAHDYFRGRQGRRKKTVQVNERDGRLLFGIVTDIHAACEAQREAYRPRCEELALDYGLRTLFATDRGDLLGRGFLRKLERFDQRISRLAAYRQKHGLPTRSPRYDREVRRLRGFLRTEIGRVLNRVVEAQRPGRIVVERLWFRNPRLSRRMNRLVTNAGRRIVEQKLTDLHEQYGIEIEYVNPAYSSQTCSACDYVDRNNRTGERFRCGWCGRTLHADVNASRNLRSRRSRPAVGSVEQAKAAVLRAQVLIFQRLCMERWGNPQGRRGTSRDPRVENAYFARYTPEVTSSRIVATSALAACATQR
ncbi:MAG: zinc ribbon domain-containing protein [Nitriliruptoraceae bacterium]